MWFGIAQRSTEAARHAERLLRAAEIEAATSAQPTLGSVELLNACRHTHRPVAIVSNNSSDAIANYLEREGLTDLVEHVEGPRRVRPGTDEAKPPCLHRAIQAIAANPQPCVFVGDSESDAMAACTADVPFIGYANRPEKGPRLHETSAPHVLTSLHTLADLMAGTR